MKSLSWDKAYQERVDDLLKSSQFGIHWGRHWLDVARFGRIIGRDINVSYPYAWRYRDYVIEAVNQDKPYNEFIREQLAGDLLAYIDDQDRAAKLSATGFLAVGSQRPQRNESSAVRARSSRRTDRRRLQATMGLTVACARCHDHKFDPIPQNRLHGRRRHLPLDQDALRRPRSSTGPQRRQAAGPSDKADLPQVNPSLSKAKFSSCSHATKTSIVRWKSCDSNAPSHAASQFERQRTFGRYSARSG